MQTKTILAIHAHPDDVEILAAGTLTLLAAAGHSIRIVTMTPGDCGSHQHTPEEIAAIRRAEATRSAAHIGASYDCVELRDLAIFNEDRSRRLVTEVLRRLRPDIVLTASPVDYMCDHEATSALVRDACFAAPAPNFATGATDPAPAIPAIPHLYFMDPIGGTDREERPIPADFYVDVTPVFDTKRQMLAEHRSQRDWLLRHHGIDNYLLQMEEWTRARGRLAGIELAEGFRQYRGHAYPLTPALQELVAAHCGDTSIHTPNSGPWRALPDRTGTCYEPVHTASVAARKRSQADGPSEDDTPINFQEFNYLTA